MHGLPNNTKGPGRRISDGETEMIIAPFAELLLKLEMIGWVLRGLVRQLEIGGHLGRSLCAGLEGCGGGVCGNRTRVRALFGCVAASAV